MSTFHLQPNEQPISDQAREEILASPGFGDYYSDHMVVAQWTSDDSWHGHRITATAPLQLHPSAAVLHYGQEIFEGLKAYRHDDGTVWLFRPEMNAARFARSATRMGMPPLPEQTFLDSLFEWMQVDQGWVPPNTGWQCLYIRPFMIASEPLIGVRAANQYTYCVLGTPAGNYYNKPMKLWITPNYSRASQGGTGEAKCGGNYAASLAVAEEAATHGCGQVLWLDAAEHKWIEECGTMNIFFITSDRELITPSLRGTILAGVTRDSVLKLAEDHDLTPVERPIDLDEMTRRLADGTITEVLACGTAAAITSITGFVDVDGNDLPVGNGEEGPITLAIREQLMGIQFGHVEDTRGWMHRVGGPVPAALN